MSKKILGIDLGAGNIKLACVKINRNSLFISDPHIVRTPGFMLHNGQITDKDEFANLLKEAVAGVNAGTRRTVVVLNDTMSISRESDIPAVSSKEREQMLRLEASEYLPEDIKDYTIRHRILLPKKNNPRGMDYILTSIAKTSLMEEIHEIVQNAGLVLEAIDVPVNCMLKYMRQVLKAEQAKSEEEKAVAVLDLGAGAVKMAIFRGVNPMFQQTLNHSSQRIDVMISNSLNVEREQAENYKIMYGLDYLDKQYEDKTGSAVSTIVSSQINLMLNDVYKNLQSFISRNDYKPVSEIRLTGGTALMKGLCKYISDAFSIPCKLVHTTPFIGLSDSITTSTGAYGKSEWMLPFTTNIAGAAHRGE